MKDGEKIKFNTYGRTPRGKTPRWITIFIISLYALLFTVFLFAGIVISVYSESVFPILITFLSVSLFAFLITLLVYNMNNAYIEIENETIKIIDFPVFKKRQRIVLLRDVKKAKWRAGRKGQLPYLVFKSHKNKRLFQIDAVPEVLSYFESLGIKVEY